MVEGESRSVRYSGVDQALSDADTALRLFGKPEVRGKRRMGVGLALGASLEEARAKARRVVQAVQVHL